MSLCCDVLHYLKHYWRNVSTFGLFSAFPRVTLMLVTCHLSHEIYSCLVRILKVLCLLRLTLFNLLAVLSNLECCKSSLNSSIRTLMIKLLEGRSMERGIPGQRLEFSGKGCWPTHWLPVFLPNKNITFCFVGSLGDLCLVLLRSVRLRSTSPQRIHIHPVLFLTCQILPL